MKPGVIDLGGLTAEIIEAPGHTPGSAVVYVPEWKLLLSGDDWNPCTWLFFPQALGLREYRSNMRGIQQLPFEKVLCPHREALYDRWMFDDFFNASARRNRSISRRMSRLIPVRRRCRMIKCSYSTGQNQDYKGDEDDEAGFHPHSGG